MSIKNLLPLLVMLLCRACTNNNALQQRSGQQSNLHVRLAVSPGSEPMFFFQNQGLYHVYYAPAGDKPTGITRITSNDLLHWTEKEISFLPEMNTSILRGGISLDSNNITGFGTRENPPLVALLTATDQEDSMNSVSKRVTPLLAYSKDGGNSWAVDSGILRLPKAFTEHPQHISLSWFGPGSKWITTLALNDHIEFFSSADLRTWSFESTLGSDFFPEEVTWKRSSLFLSADNNTWVVLADIKKAGVTRTSGGTVYFAGDFDGHKFINQSSQLHWLDYGEDVYGTLSCPAIDGRRIHMAWKSHTGEIVSNNNQATTMTLLPRELALEHVNGESFIRVLPTRELSRMHARKVELSPEMVSYKAGYQELISGLNLPLEIFLKFNTSHIQRGSFPTRFGVGLWNNSEEHMDFGFDRFGFYYLDTSGFKTSAATPLLNSLVKMPYDHTDSSMELHMIVDSSTIECFAEGGKLVMTSSYSSAEPFNSLKLFSLNGDIRFEVGKIVELDARKK